MSAFKTPTSTYSAPMSRSDDCSNMYSSATPSQPAICIPRVFPNITRRRILAIFGNLSLGDVCRIDMVPRVAQDGSEFFRVFVHLAWSDNEAAVEARKALVAGNEVKIIYDDPWFWKLRASNSKGPHQRVHRPAPRIVMEKPAEKPAEPVSSSNNERPKVHASDVAYEDASSVV